MVKQKLSGINSSDKHILILSRIIEDLVKTMNNDRCEVNDFVRLEE